jgi:hypothetical protein
MGPCLISHGDLWQDLDFVVVETNLIVLPFVNVFKVINPMQVVQYTSNRFYDINKYTNRLNTYKYVMRCICFATMDYFG